MSINVDYVNRHQSNIYKPRLTSCHYKNAEVLKTKYSKISNILVFVIIARYHQLGEAIPYCSFGFNISKLTNLGRRAGIVRSMVGKVFFNSVFH